MNCSDFHPQLNLYADGRLDGPERNEVDNHLANCPLCRQTFAEIRQIKTDLQMAARNEIPAAVTNRVRFAIGNELRVGSSHTMSLLTRDWLGMRLMPLGVGVVASLVIGLSFLTMMFSAARSAADVAEMNAGPGSRILLAANKDPFSDGRSTDISAADYARTRLAVAAESPSINPKGALVALTRSLIRGNMNDDEVVVVADVFSNGLAKITDVVEPSRNSAAVGELERALQSDVSSAPFVPAVLDNRSENVRVVLRFQSVIVSTADKRKKR